MADSDTTNQPAEFSIAEHSIAPHLHAVVKELEEGALNQDPPGTSQGILSGFPKLDEATGGFQPGELTVISGELPIHFWMVTSLVDNIAISPDNPHPLGMFSLRRSGRTFVRDLVHGRARVKRIPYGYQRYDNGQFIRCMKAAGEIDRSTILIDDRNRITMEELRATVLLWRSEIDLLIIDPIEHIEVERPTGRLDYVRGATEIASGLKSLAEEVNIPLVVFGETPRGSGRFYDASDTFMEMGLFENHASLQILKHRRYRTDVYQSIDPITFQYHIHRFYEVSNDED